MGLFGRKPTLADIYVKELASELDHYVALFPPDAPDVRVGTIGRYDDEGRFERRGHLDELVGGASAFIEQVPSTPPTQPASWWFRTEQSVKLEPQGTLTTPLGQELLKGRLSFSGDRAVVASFAGVVETQVQSPRAFDKLLWKLYTEGDLAPDEVVVWACRSATTGTVLLNRKGGVDVELTLDPALVGGVLGWEGLGAGVTFGAGSQASTQMSGANLTVGVRSKGLSEGDVVAVEEVRGFQGGGPADLSAFDDVEVPEVTEDRLLDGADWSLPED